MFVLSQQTLKFRATMLISALIVSLVLGVNTGYAANNYLSKAQEHAEKEDYNSAIIELKNLLQKDPNNAEGRLLIGKIYIKKGNLLAGIKELQQARTLGTTSSEWLIPLTRSYLHSNQFDKVLESKALLNDLTPASQAELLAILGHAHLGTNQLIEAKDVFQQALALNKNAYALVGQARLANTEKRAEDSLRLLDKALAIAPQNLEALTTKTQVLADQGQIDEALDAVNQALAIDKNLIQALLIRSQLYTRSGDLAAARGDAESILKRVPYNPQANIILARLQLQAKEYKAAQVSAEKVLRAVPNHSMTHLTLGTIHFALENFEQTQFFLEKFVAIQPSHIPATRLLGATYLHLGDANSSIELLEPIDTTIDHKDAQLLNVLGQAYLRKGNYEKGTATLSRALTMDPSIQGVRTQLAIGELAIGNINSAVSQLEGAAEKADSTVQSTAMLILSYIRLNQQEKAAAAIDKALNQYPNQGVFYYLKGLGFLAQKNPTAASDAYKTAVEVQPEYILGYLAQANLDLQNNDFEAAKNNYQKALKIAPSHLQTLLLRAYLAQQEGNTEDMLLWLFKAKEGNPDAIAPVTVLVKYFLQANQPDKALSEAREFSTDRRDDIASLSLLARIHATRKEYKKAISYLQQVIGLDPNDLSHRMQLAQMSSADQNFREALGYINDVLTISPNHIPALVAKTGALIKLNQIYDTETSIKEFSELYPDSYLNHQLMGDLLAAKNQLSEALAAYEKAYVINKSSYLANALGHLYYLNNQPQKTTRVLTEYLAEFPDDIDIRLKLAGTYQQLAQNKKAINQYEAIIKQVSDNHAVLNNLAWLYWLEGDERSLETAQKAYQLAPDDSAISDTYGWIMLHKGDKKDALSIIQATVFRAPASPDIRYHLAKALSANGKKDQALKEVSRLLRDYSGFEEENAAKQLLSTLEVK